MTVQVNIYLNNLPVMPCDLPFIAIRSASVDRIINDIFNRSCVLPLPDRAAGLPQKQEADTSCFQ